MSGRARNPHLKRRLLLALLPSTLLLVSLGVASDYFVARRLTDDAYDQSIAGVAQGLALTLERDRDNDLAVHFNAMMRTLQRIDAPDTWRYVVIKTSGELIDGDTSLLPAIERAGPANPTFRTLTLGSVPERIATFRYGGGTGAIIVVAETVQRRRTATNAIVGAAIWPNAALMALAIVLLLVSARLALQPLDRLSERIDGQRVDDLVSLPLTGTPHETLSLVRALNHLIDRLRLSSKSQQAFLNQAAHQLRTPLAALRTRLELLRETPPEDVRARCAALEADVARLSHLTTQLLMLGRTDAGAATALDRTVVDIAALITELAPSFDDHARALGVQLAFELAPLQIDGVEWMLREALANLVDNAIEHSPADGTVTLRCGPCPGQRGRVDIEDQGEGVAPELRDRMFEPFVRASETRRPGSGLGLAIVRSIAERHGATVSLECGSSGLGTLACIRFA